MLALLKNFSGVQTLRRIGLFRALNIVSKIGCCNKFGKLSKQTPMLCKRHSVLVRVAYVYVESYLEESKRNCKKPLTFRGE